MSMMRAVHVAARFCELIRACYHVQEKLEDRDTSAVSCAVNVICELARKNPQNYLALAPLFFKLLTVTANNWMLIKIVKRMSTSLRDLKVP
jgi:AP-3 complex subunit delta-1